MALRLAHRGDWRRAPENTIAAFLAALDVPGCDGLEFDVRAAADGVPVVIHDDTLARVQGSRARRGPDAGRARSATASRRSRRCSPRSRAAHSSTSSSRATPGAARSTS